jgi:Fe-S cluster assembly protein SufD
MTTPGTAAVASEELRGMPALFDGAARALGARPREALPWLEAIRAESAAGLLARGFPKPKDEAYRFTPLRAVLSAPYEGPGAGGFRPAAPSPGTLVESFSELLRNDPGRLEPFLARGASSADGFVLHNTALFRDGLAVFTEKGRRGLSLRLDLRSDAGAASLALPRLLVVVAADSELTLVEAHEPPAAGRRFENGVTEIVLEEGARLTHVRVLVGAAERASVAHVAVRQGPNSVYTSRVFTAGGALSRLHLDVVLAGEGAECVADGLYVARDGDLVDHHTRIEHASPRATSRQKYKGVLDGNGIAVFDGTIVVRAGASGTEAHQENRNLLLSGDAVAHSKPHLEIDTDDVKCSHGATVGRLDPAQLFYLRSRGLDLPFARAMLTRAFATEMVDRVTEPVARAAVDAALAEALPAGPGAEGA